MGVCGSKGCRSGIFIIAAQRADKDTLDASGLGLRTFTLLSTVILAYQGHQRKKCMCAVSHAHERSRQLQEKMMITLQEGARIPFAVFEEAQETDKGAMKYSSYTMRDGYIIYEAVEQNSAKCPKFFVVEYVGTDSVIAVIDTVNDTRRDAYRKISEAKEKRR